MDTAQVMPSYTLSSLFEDFFAKANGCIIQECVFIKDRVVVRGNVNVPSLWLLRIASFESFRSAYSEVFFQEVFLHYILINVQLGFDRIDFFAIV